MKVPTTCVECGAKGETEGPAGMVHKTIICIACQARKAAEPAFQGTKGAIVSTCGQYRYALWRRWSRRGKLLMVIGLNPSTADASRDDPTIRRLVRYAADWGMSGLLMGNLFAFRSTYPGGLWAPGDPVGPQNDAWLLRMKAEADLILGAWGMHACFDLNRTLSVLKLFPNLSCLGITANGHPRHPLRLSATLQPQPFCAGENLQKEA